MDGTRILIVDDEADAGEILSLRLARRGFAPCCADSGEKALELLAQNPVDVVLLDVKMPGMGGLEVLRHITADYPDVAVIMLSGHADMEAAAQGLQGGAFSYQLKPVDLETILNKVEDAIKQKKLERA